MRSLIKASICWFGGSLGNPCSARLCSSYSCKLLTVRNGFMFCCPRLGGGLGALLPTSTCCVLPFATLGHHLTSILPHNLEQLFDSCGVIPGEMCYTLAYSQPFDSATITVSSDAFDNCALI
jgi:hypothetical protein